MLVGFQTLSFQYNTTPCGWRPNSHFTDEETEALRGPEFPS